MCFYFDQLNYSLKENVGRQFCISKPLLLLIFLVKIGNCVQNIFCLCSSRNHMTNPREDTVNFFPSLIIIILKKKKTISCALWRNKSCIPETVLNFTYNSSLVSLLMETRCCGVCRSSSSQTWHNGPAFSSQLPGMPG